MTDTSPFLRLKEERKRLKLTQATASAVAGVSRETWSRYEGGSVSPGMEVLVAFALAGADVQYVLTGLHGSASPTTRERLFLDQFRRSTEAQQDAALRVLLNEERVQAEKSQLVADEQMLLDGYRALDAASKKQMLASMILGEPGGAVGARASINTTVSGSGNRVAGRDFHTTKE